jgi:hypothetical protein
VPAVAPPDGDDLVAADVEWTSTARRVRSVEDDEDAAAEAVDLGALVELLRIGERERRDLHEPRELLELLVGGIDEVQPEELVALVERPDRVRVVALEDLHPAPRR